MTLDRSIEVTSDFLRWLVSLPGWAWGQFSAFIRNVYVYIVTIQFDRLLPPSITGLVTWLMGTFPRALGLRDTSPAQQMNASVVLILVSLLSSFLTFGATLIVSVFFGITFLIGFYRWIPAVNDLWNDFRDRLPIKRDYDVPFWSKE